jgi:hypothetical protein
MSGPTRRTVAKGVAWSVPAVAVAMPAAAMAASGTAQIVAHQECKCPGESHPLSPKNYVFTVVFDSPVSSFSVDGKVTVGGKSYTVVATFQVSSTTWRFKIVAPSSADLSGLVSYTYVADGVPGSASYVLIATPPCRNGEC